VSGQSLEAELERARDLDVSELADAIETIGFECTRCGACCKGHAGDEHTATVFPEEVRKLQTDACGDCTFYTEDEGTGACTVHDARPLVCRTYPFSVDLATASQPMGEAVDREGPVRAHECEGLGRDISREDAEDLARALKERAVRDVEEAIALRENYEPAGVEGVVVHDSEGAKRPDGTPLFGGR
jgi:Fe-S-cluster containining protein